MANVPVKEVRLVVVVDDLDLKLELLHFRQRCSIGVAPLIVVNRNMEDLGYAYLHCDLLNKIALTTITLKVPYMEMHK